MKNNMDLNSGSSLNFGHNKPSFWRHIWEWAKVIVIALLISLPIRFFIAEPFIVKGQSMDPTFSTNQFLIVDRLSYRFEKPSRGDVIIFEYPNDPNVYYIKRIIGLPNETLKIDQGVISIIDPLSSSTPEVLNEPYVKEIHKSYENMSVTLGPTEYFVMGDNRLESSDSRAWGPLKREKIIGRPAIRLFPITKLSIFPGEFKPQQ